MSRKTVLYGVIFLTGCFGVGGGFVLSGLLNNSQYRDMGSSNVHQRAQYNGSIQKNMTLFEKHAVEANMGNCSGLFSMLGQSVVGEATYAAQTKWNTESAKNHSVESLVSIIENKNADPGIRAAGMVFTAPVANSCEGTFVRVTPMKKTCKSITESLAQLNAKNELLGDTSLMLMPNGARVMLIPFDSSCIAVTSLNATG